MLELNGDLDFVQREVPWLGDQAYVPGEGRQAMTDDLFLALDAERADVGIAEDFIVRRLTAAILATQEIGGVGSAFAEESTCEGASTRPAPETTAAARARSGRA